MHLEKIEGNTLIIGVYQASWLQELYLLSTVLLKTINNNLKYPYIKKLRFKHASPLKKKSIQPIIKTIKKIEYKPIVLSNKEVHALE